MLPAISSMIPITIEQLLADFDAILSRVEAGESFLITNTTEGANAVVLIPYRD